MSQKHCAACRHWAGTPHTHMAPCTAPGNIGQTAFNASCAAYETPGQPVAPENDWQALRLQTAYAGPHVSVVVRDKHMNAVAQPPRSAFPSHPQPSDLYRPVGYVGKTYKARVLMPQRGHVSVEWIEQ